MLGACACDDVDQAGDPGHTTMHAHPYITPTCWFVCSDQDCWNHVCVFVLLLFIVLAVCFLCLILH